MTFPNTEDDADKPVIPFILLLAIGSDSEHVHQLLNTLAASHLALWTCVCLSGVAEHPALPPR